VKLHDDRNSACPPLRAALVRQHRQISLLPARVNAFSEAASLETSIYGAPANLFWLQRIERLFAKCAEFARKVALTLKLPSLFLFVSIVQTRSREDSTSSWLSSTSDQSAERNRGLDMVFKRQP
jgi:hypothetical protein